MAQRRLNYVDFENYMRKQKLSPASIMKYAHNTPDKFDVQVIFDRLTGYSDMYAITSKILIERVINAIRESDFDIVGQRMYSCGVKKYLKFLEDTGNVTK